MNQIIDQLLVLVMLLNFLGLGTSRMHLAIRTVALQGVLLGLLPGLTHALSLHLAVMTGGIILTKGLLIPWLLFRAMRRVEIREDVEPFLSHTASLVLAAIATALAFVFAAKLPLAPQHQGLLFVPASIATIIAGFLVLTTRKKAITQVIGYLILENGIFIFGLLLSEVMPLMVEAGVLLDLIVGIFVMGIIINQISREFSSIDTSRLTALREEQ